MGRQVEQVITATILRTAVRSKLRAGASNEAVSVLVLTYVPPERRTQRAGDGFSRQALENIPHTRRAEFLNSLINLPVSAAHAASNIRRTA